MSAILGFIKEGWKNIWKQKLIFIFSVYALFGQLFYIVQALPNWRSLDPILYMVGSFIVIALVFTGYFGIPYIAYHSSIEKSITYQDALAGIRKFMWRILGCSFLGVIIILPYLFLLLSFSIDRVHRTVQFSDKSFIGLLVGSAFIALYYFTLASIFAHDQGVFKSFQEAWKLFTNHFIVLALLGIIMSIVFRAYATVAGMLTLMFQSGFDLSELINLNFINPFATVGKNVLFILLNSLGLIILTPLNSAIFISAYRKYTSQTKSHPVSKARSIKAH